MKFLIDLLRDPAVQDIDVDSDTRMTIHSQMLGRKKMLQQVFTDFHYLFDQLDRRFFSGVGQRIEIGAGIAPMRDSYKDVLATDIVPAPFLDRALNAQQMDLVDGSVRAFFAQNCFHHFPDPDKFFGELTRVLNNQGGVVILEPFYGPVATFMFKRLFATEGYDKTFGSWQTPTIGPMNGANQALSYLIFVRDRVLFEQKYPQLRIVYESTCDNYLCYLLSGGLNFRQLAPDWGVGGIRILEKLFSPLNRLLALHHVVVIRKEL